MNDFTPNYRAPCRYPHNRTLNQCESGYEPTGSSTITDGSNLTDFVTFCRNCHNQTNIIYSTTLGRNLKTINWTATGDKHGKRNADGSICVYFPYKNVLPACDSAGLSKVLSCLDCHEPHGAPNVVLIRKEVNGAQWSGTITTINSTDCFPTTIDGTPYTDTNNEMVYLCNMCHQDPTLPGSTSYFGIHHNSEAAGETAPYPGPPNDCERCHVIDGTTEKPVNCNCCHYHGENF